ncbi:MAG TPA: site-specific integrase [Ktedonobacteraceae bacterium]|nr:site-specific integrase [Ktedonobacteraceae bacterium]
MRVTERIQGRFVSTYGMKKVVCLPESRYELIIVDCSGKPVSHLTEWYRLRKQPGCDGTRRTYLNFLLPFFCYLLKNGADWNREPEYIRAQIKTFLREETACQVARDHDTDGYRVQLSGASVLSQSSMRVLFAALRDFYLVMHDAGLYAYTNPMQSELLSKWKREHLKAVANRGAPDHAGIRGETRRETRSYSTTFFRLKRKHMWQPALALEPDLVLQRLHDAITFMIQHTQTQRDRVILLLLNQTGARLSEILGLTAGGYRKARHACRALVTNKGSLGREEKTIYFTPEIERALHLYIRTERVHHDPQGRKRLEALADHEPLFLTRRGTPYTRSSWYYHWSQWLASVPPDEYTGTLGPVVFTAHDIRHVFVSRIIRQMKRKYAHDATKQAALQWALQQCMGWRSPLTVLCYDHSESDRERLEQFDPRDAQRESLAEQ